MVSRFKKGGPPLGARPLKSRKRNCLDRRDVRSLEALGALHDFEFDALAFGQRLVALTGDRGEVDEHVVLTFALDEAIALLVREPLNGALSQRSSFVTQTNDGPGTEPPN